MAQNCEESSRHYMGDFDDEDEEDEDEDQNNLTKSTCFLIIQTKKYF